MSPDAPVNFLQTLSWIFYKAFQFESYSILGAGKNQLSRVHTFYPVIFKTLHIVLFWIKMKLSPIVWEISAQELVLYLSYVYNAEQFKYCKKKLKWFSETLEMWYRYVLNHTKNSVFCGRWISPLFGLSISDGKAIQRLIDRHCNIHILGHSRHS